MAAFAGNPFALLSDDPLPAPGAKGGDAKKTADKKPQQQRKDGQSQQRSQQGQQQQQGGGQQGPHPPHRGGSGSTPFGRGGRVSAPRPQRDAPAANYDDFTGGKPERSERTAPHERRDQYPRRPRPDGPRFDRRSGTGRVDSEKKEVAGHSWGDAVEAVGVTEGQSATVAAETAENPPTDEAVPSPPTKPAEEDDKTKSFAQYEAEKKARKSLKASGGRKANEGVDESAWKNAQVLDKPQVDSSDDLAALLLGSKRHTTQKRKERKEKVAVDIAIRFTEDPARRQERMERRGPPRGGEGGAPGGGAPSGDVRRDTRPFSERGPPGAGGSPRGGFGGRGGGRGGFQSGGGAPRGGFRSGARDQPVNVNDMSAFPSLA